MKTHRVPLGALALGLLFLPAAAQSNATPSLVAQDAPAPVTAEELPSARSVVDRFLEKTKVRSVLEKHESAHVSAKFTLLGMEIEGELDAYSKKPDLLYTELSLGPIGEVRQGCSSGVSWRIHPMLGTSLLDGMEEFQFQQQADWDNLLKDAKDFESMKTVAREEFEGEACNVLEFVAKAPEGSDDKQAKKTAKLRTHREFYAVESGLLIGIEGVAASPMGETKTVTHLSDYKDFGGALSAARTTVKAGGQSFEIRVSSVEYDEVEDEVFALPAAIHKLAEARAAKLKRAEEKEAPKEKQPEGGAGGEE